MKKHNSKRNRHTGRVNSFKRFILNNGEHVVIGGTLYARLRVGNLGGVTVVRIPAEG